MNAAAIILAYRPGRHLGILSHKRASSAVPYAGKYRIIDFVLSNCVNSDIRLIGILTQYRPRSLNDHIRTGRPWDLDRMFSGGVTLLPPYQRQASSPGWYCGTADAVYQNLDFVLGKGIDTVLVLSGEHIYKMDYNPILRYHHENQADATVCVVDVQQTSLSQFRARADSDHELVGGSQNKLFGSPNKMVPMGVFVFQIDFLAQRLAEDAQLSDSNHDFANDVLLRMLRLGDRIRVWPFGGYWRPITTIRAYWEANMELLAPDPPLNLLDLDWRIHTRDEERPPANILPSAGVSNSLVTDGCVIEGRVEDTILSPGVRIRAGAMVRDSIIFSDCDIGSSTVLDCSVLDKNVVVGADVRVGLSAAGIHPSCGHLNGLSSDITLIGKNTRLPAGLRVGCGCVIGSDLVENDFTAGLVSDGECFGFQPSGTDLGTAHTAHRLPKRLCGDHIERSNRLTKIVSREWFGSAPNRA
jgi:glucose-1-phosphate adenylyltransferase